MRPALLLLLCASGLAFGQAPAQLTEQRMLAAHGLCVLQRDLAAEQLRDMTADRDRLRADLAEAKKAGN